MKRSIIEWGVVAAAAVCTIGVAGAGVAEAGAEDYFDSGWTESTIDLGIDDQIIMIPTNR